MLCSVLIRRLLLRLFSWSQTDDVYQFKIRLQGLEHAKGRFIDMQMEGLIIMFVSFCLFIKPFCLLYYSFLSAKIDTGKLT